LYLDDLEVCELTSPWSIGATGNIGAAVLEALVAAHPELVIEVLVLSEQDANSLKDFCSGNVNLVHGSLEDLLLLEEKGSEADIIISECRGWRVFSY
jgi:nucleoside-diphosphate-sugar epimerase